jgi:hypothetical protein
MGILVLLRHDYLSIVYDEARKRGYRFDKNKINWNFELCKVPVTTGQIKYEAAHLLKKLKTRDISAYNIINDQKEFFAHPLFKVTDGNIEKWEILN